MTPERRREYEARRRSEKRWRNWYKLKAWLVARAAQLAKQPLCERCLQRKRIVAATVVNHRKPHKGDWALFIDPANHESSCKPCHDGEIQQEERTGYVAGCDEHGRPLDPNHPWNRKAA
jgi:5-methylcytosine-specific restriction protein A